MAENDAATVATATSDAGAPPEAATTGTPPGGSTGEPRQQPRTYTDQEVNDLIAREKRKALDAPEIKEAKAAAARLAKMEADQKTAEEKLTERATTAEKLAEERQGKYRTALIRSAFTTQAAAKGIPGDRIDAAFRLADLSTVEVDEATDAVSGVEKAIAALPEWLAAPQARAVPDINAGGGQSTPDPKAREDDLRRRFRLSP